MFGSESTTGIYITLVITVLAFGLSLRLRPFADRWASDLSDYSRWASIRCVRFGKVGGSVVSVGTHD